MPYKDPAEQKAAQHRAYVCRKDAIRKSQKERRSEIRRKVREYKLEHGCNECGYNKCAAAIDPHHPNGKNSPKDTIAYLCDRGFAWKTILAELENCIMLCANCHRELHDV